MSLTEEAIQSLIQQSFQAKKQAYARYSKFPVGAALLCKDGTVITGCNVENASYGLTVCAERAAVCRAVIEGHRQFKAVAVSSDMTDEYIVPCGMCRQTLKEFANDMDVYMTKPDGTYKHKTLLELLPNAFTPDRLEDARI